jgi:hypothetical protein
VKTFKYPNSQIIFAAIKKLGLLLESDQKLPSVASLIANEPIRGSWWSHAKSQEIFEVLQEIADDKDVLITKLLSGKVTFVHRKLWCEVSSIGSSREDWQIAKISAAARVLLEQVDQQESLLTNELKWPQKFKTIKPGEAVRELEKQLLLHTEQFHTASGEHAKRLQSWQHWSKSARLNCKPITVEAAKKKLEKRVAELNEQFGSSAKLPWPTDK